MDIEPENKLITVPVNENNKKMSKKDFLSSLLDSDSTNSKKKATKQRKNNLKSGSKPPTKPVKPLKYEVKSKKKRENVQKIAQKIGPTTSTQLPSEAPSDQNLEKNLHVKIGDLERQIFNINQELQNLSYGANGDKQAAQTLPQMPSELRHRDFGEAEESYSFVSNGGVSNARVQSDSMKNREPMPFNPMFNSADVFFF